MALVREVLDGTTVSPTRWNTRVRDRQFVGWCDDCGARAFGDLCDLNQPTPGPIMWATMWCMGVPSHSREVKLLRPRGGLRAAA